MNSASAAPAADDPAAAARFEAFLASFDAAAARTGIIHRNYEIAGLTVHLRFAGNAMLPEVTTAFAHLEVDPIANPALTISCWDAVSTGVELLPQVGSRADYEHAQTESYQAGRYLSGYRRPDFGLSMLDRETGRGGYWLPDAVDYPSQPDPFYWGWANPLRGILNWWFIARDRLFVHAAAVGAGGGALLMPGPSGSGKTSTALRCLVAGMDFLGEDYSVVSLEGQPAVHSIYSTAKLHAHEYDAGTTQVRLPVEHVRKEFDKYIFPLYPHFARQLVPSRPLRAIVVPRVTGVESPVLSPCGAGLALAALAPSSILQVPGAGQAAFSRMRRLVTSLPCYFLQLGGQSERIPGMLEALLRDLEGGQAPT